MKLSPVEVNVRRGTRTQKREGVRIMDTAAGVLWEVVPVRVGGQPGLIYMSRTAIAGTLGRGSHLSEERLAIIALDHLAEQKKRGMHGFTSRPRDSWSVDGRRPSDDRLLLVIRDAIAANESVRHTLSKLFGVSVYMADHWIAHARSLPGANLPAPRRGRPPGRRNLNNPTKEK